LKKIIGITFLALLMISCEDGGTPDTQVNTTTGNSTIEMRPLGVAHAGLNEPINGCKVYAFKIEGFYQTAVYCKNGTVTTASAHHEKTDKDESGE